MRYGVSRRQFRRIDKFVTLDGIEKDFKSYRGMKYYLKNESYFISYIEEVNGETVAYIAERATETKSSFSMAAYTALVMFLAVSGFMVAHAASNGGFTKIAHTISGVIQQVSSGGNLVDAVKIATGNDSRSSAVETGSTVTKTSSNSTVSSDITSDDSDAVDGGVADTDNTADGVISPVVKSVDIEAIKGDIATYNGDYFELQVFGDLLIDSNFKEITISNEDKNNCSIQFQFDISLNNGTVFTILSDRLQAGKDDKVDLYTPIIEKIPDLDGQVFGTVLITTHCYDAQNSKIELNGLTQEVSINVSK